MWRTLKLLFHYVSAVMRSRYVWLLLIYALWAYRVGYIANDAGGFARILQIGCLAVMVLLVSLYSSGTFGRAWTRSNAPVRWVCALYVYATASALWSIMPFFSAFLALQNIVLIVCLYWLLTRGNSFVSRERTFLLFSLGMMLFDAVSVRTLGGGFRWFVHHLTNGSTAAMMLSYCTAEWWGMRRNDRRRRALLKGCLVWSAVLLVLATSSGANASAAFGVGVAAFLSGKVLIYLVLFVGALFLFVYREQLDEIILLIMPGKTKETLESATGRAALWDIMLELAAQKPWFGWGYACIERAATLTGRIQSPDAHNNYLGLYGSLGYVGSAIAYLGFASTLFHAWARRLRPGYKGLIAAYCCALLNGYTYGYLAGKACNITVMFFALVVLTYAYAHVKVYDDTTVERQD